MHVENSEKWIASRIITAPASIADILASGISAEAIEHPKPYAVISTAQQLFERGELSSSEVLRTEVQETTDQWDEWGGMQWWRDMQRDGWIEDDLEYHTRRVGMAYRVRKAMEAASRTKDKVEGATLDAQDDAVRSLSSDLLTIQAVQQSSVHTAEDMSAGFLDALAHGRETRLKTGIWSIDKLTGGLPLGRITVVAAPSSHGKTAFADAIAMNCALRWKRQGAPKRVLKFDLEQSVEDNELRYVTQLANRQHLKGGVARIEGDEVEAALNGTHDLPSQKKACLTDAATALAELPITIDDQAGAGVSYMRARVQAMEAQDEVPLVIVDYAELIQAPGDGKVERLGRAILELHELARHRNISVVLLSQLNRKNLSRASGRPQIGDISWSDAARKYSKMMLLNFHPHEHWQQTETEGDVPEPSMEDYEINVAKNKGATGTVALTFRPYQLTFSDPRAPGGAQDRLGPDRAPDNDDRTTAPLPDTNAPF